MYLNGMGLRGIERVTEIHHTTIMHWVREAGHQLKDAPESEEIPEVTDLDELPFVQSLFAEAEDELVARYFATKIALDPATWRLHKLKEPLHIHCVEPLCEELIDEEGYSTRST